MQSCAFDGMDTCYTYSGLEVIVSPINGQDKVYSVYFIDDSVETNEGIKISDSKQAMIEKYGEQYSILTGNKYTYTKGNVELSFMVENDTIISIEYILKI